MKSPANLSKLSDDALDTLFRNARTHYHWTNAPVEDGVLKELWDLCKMGPTSANCLPMRLVFIKSKGAKEKLKSCLDAGNVDKAMQAPVTAIIGYDLKFYENLEKTFPHAPDAIHWFKGNDTVIQDTAFRNSTLQGAYLILAARSLGLDCGPMSGFSKEKIEASFFPETAIKANFLCNLGYGDASKLHPRAPRLSFEETSTII